LALNIDENIYSRDKVNGNSFDTKNKFQIYNKRGILEFQNLKNILLRKDFVRIDFSADYETSGMINIAGSDSQTVVSDIRSKILVLDLDLNDLRTLLLKHKISICACGSEKKICEQCWVDLAIPIMNWIEIYFMEKYETKVFVFFSGQKGFHAFVGGPWASLLSNTDRVFLLNSIEKFILQKLVGSKILPKKLAEDKEFLSSYKVFDKDVTTVLNHLIRLPFTHHPVTFNLTWPISKDVLYKDLFVNIQDFTMEIHGPILKKRLEMLK